MTTLAVNGSMTNQSIIIFMSLYSICNCYIIVYDKNIDKTTLYVYFFFLGRQHSIAFCLFIPTTFYLLNW